ncbi:hypothetical protein ANCDUO_01048 [Ancylostoma duodenale]|uniref:Uncharacterized protein n=1 Tax=Ancylostoma duodenale TaxID=51022 RepID=A0A0C2DZX4_9BILA|nr:hypothetical protein ANCDUO_01048 [Ancylostoma duodenale]
MEETERIKFDVIGLCETKSRNPLSCTWSSGAGVFLGSWRDNSTSGGIGFIVAPHLIPKIQQCFGFAAGYKDQGIGDPNLSANRGQGRGGSYGFPRFREIGAKCRSYYKIITEDFNAYVGRK